MVGVAGRRLAIPDVVSVGCLRAAARHGGLRVSELDSTLSAASVLIRSCTNRGRLEWFEPRVGELESSEATPGAHLDVRSGACMQTAW